MNTVINNKLQNFCNQYHIKSPDDFVSFVNTLKKNQKDLDAFDIFVRVNSLFSLDNEFVDVISKTCSGETCSGENVDICSVKCDKNAWYGIRKVLNDKFKYKERIPVNVPLKFDIDSWDCE